MNKHFAKKRFVGILIVLAALAVFSAVAMVLWNALMPDILALPTLNYWQAAGILVLARILFGGLDAGLFRPRGGYGGDERLSRQGNQLREEWMNMTEEERKAFFEKEKDFMWLRKGFYRFHNPFGENDPEAKKEKPASQGDSSSQGDGNE